MPKPVKASRTSRPLPPITANPLKFPASITKAEFESPIKGLWEGLQKATAEELGVHPAARDMKIMREFGRIQDRFIQVKALAFELSSPKPRLLPSIMTSPDAAAWGLSTKAIMGDITDFLRSGSPNGLGRVSDTLEDLFQQGVSKTPQFSAWRGNATRWAHIYGNFVSPGDDAASVIKRAIETEEALHRVGIAPIAATYTGGRPIVAKARYGVPAASIASLPADVQEDAARRLLFAVEDAAVSNLPPGQVMHRIAKIRGVPEELDLDAVATRINELVRDGKISPTDQKAMYREAQAMFRATPLSTAYKGKELHLRLADQGIPAHTLVAEAIKHGMPEAPASVKTATGLKRIFQSMREHPKSSIGAAFFAPFLAATAYEAATRGWDGALADNFVTRSIGAAGSGIKRLAFGAPKPPVVQPTLQMSDREKLGLALQADPETTRTIVQLTAAKAQQDRERYAQSTAERMAVEQMAPSKFGATMTMNEILQAMTLEAEPAQPQPATVP